MMTSFFLALLLKCSRKLSPSAKLNRLTFTESCANSKQMLSQSDYKIKQRSDVPSGSGREDEDQIRLPEQVIRREQD